MRRTGSCFRYVPGYVVTPPQIDKIWFSGCRIIMSRPADAQAVLRTDLRYVLHNMAIYIKDIECLDARSLSSQRTLDYPMRYALGRLYTCYLVKLARSCLENLKPLANQLCHQRLRNLDDFSRHRGSPDSMTSSIELSSNPRVELSFSDGVVEHQSMPASRY